jgi:hypothetical protein
MTATETPDLAALLAADPTFLDQLADRLQARPQRHFNMAGQDIAALAAAPTGRVQVSPGQTISSASWGNPVWDQSVNCFNTAADRDSQWLTPHDGSICWQADSNTFWVRRNGVWRGLPMGVLAQVVSTANSGTTSTATTWMTAPAVTTDGIRRLRISFTGWANAGAVNDIISLQLRDGATVLQTTQARLAAAGGPGQTTLTGFWEGVPAAGSHAYALIVALVGGTSAQGVATVTSPATLLVEDIGT